MTANELFRDLNAGEVPALLFLYGKEPFLLQRAVRKVRKAVLLAEKDDFNDNQFFGKEATAVTIIDAAQTLPVFASHRLVTIKDAHLLPASEMDGLLSYLKNPVPETCLLLVADKIDSRRKFFQQFKKSGTLIEFKPLTERELPGHIRSFLDERDYRISADALELFCSMVGDSLHEVHGELEKLLIYLGERTLVDVSDVQAVVSKSRSENIFELGNAVGRGDVARALSLAKQLTDGGEAPLKILSLLVRHFRQLWKVRELQVQNCSPRDIAGTAGVPFFVVQPMIAQGKRFSRVDFRRAYELFLETDLAMKSSGADAEALLESLLLRLCRKN
ncbi:DNA polymerase III, delta subunit [Malonomonas rubra DSM 5091]|uniref:DNA polymerase III subunit delta n=1 Tax=Malonomonas rubra DSM 5091 TaxID=1122189 RepID=A0A1M6DF73_MALRU|nr:DNA polymerase III subunit delta [Malonomonas rubra]SHI71731.1 DNA polymerase III, delta subunit [Malonomonas rubra DSM 5091]